MKKEVVSLVCVFALLGGTTAAFAGAYGEQEQAEELPAPPPPAPAMAPAPEPEIDYAAPGAYIGAGGIYAIENFQHTHGLDVDNSSGFQVRGGYRFLPNLAAELLYQRYTQFDTDPVGHASGWGLFANVKGIILTGRFQPFALVGLGYASGSQSFRNEKGTAPFPTNISTDDNSAFAMRFGGGLDIYLTPNWQTGFEVAYVLPTGSLDDAQATTIGWGFNYHFR